MNSPNYHCLKSIQIRSFSCPFFLRSKSPYLVRIQEITDQKKFRIWTLCMQCTVGKLQISTFINNERGGCTFVHLTQCFLIILLQQVLWNRWAPLKEQGYNGLPQINMPFKFSWINHNPHVIMDCCHKVCEINTVLWSNNDNCSGKAQKIWKTVTCGKTQ